jgi:hypothetical protein
MSSRSSLTTRKKNAFNPQLMAQICDAITLPDRTEDYWVGVVCAEGGSLTAGLEMTKFFGPKAEMVEPTPGNVDAFALKGRCRKPIVTTVQGIVFTIGIEMMLAAISWLPPPTGGSARSKPSAASPRLAARIPRRLGRRDVPSVPLRRIRCHARPQDRLPCRRSSTSRRRSPRTRHSGSRSPRRPR